MCDGASYPAVPVDTSRSALAERIEIPRLGLAAAVRCREIDRCPRMNKKEKVFRAASKKKTEENGYPPGRRRGQVEEEEEKEEGREGERKKENTAHATAA